ncbi:MAG: TldD/PmbA family protein [Alphaproteobacteria bacterium]|nr:TldD/PmbA family protein [Alphaproteobacteria bacterium]
MSDVLSLSDAVDFLIEQAQKNGADAAESFGVDSTAVNAECRQQKTETLEHAQTSGVDLRVFCSSRPAIVSSSILEKSALKELAERAVQMAKTVPEDPYCGLADPALQAKSLPDLDLYDESEHDTQQLLELAIASEDAALSVKGVSQSNGAGASIDKSHIIMASTTGFRREYRRSSASFFVSVIAADSSGDRETDYDYSSAVYFTDLEAPDVIGKKAGERAVKRLSPRKIASQTMDIVLEPRLAREFIGTLTGAINGSSIARGTSFLKDCLHTQILPAELTLFENPHKKRGAASRPCDAEGLPCQSRALVDHGFLTTWMLDLHSARKLNMAPTAHAARGLGGSPHPSSSNLTLSGGTASPQELIANIKNGLYITQLFGQGVNMITGDYSRGAAGFLIKNGQIAGPVSEITIAGNLKEMFKNMIAANDLNERYSVNAPTICLPALSVAGK